MNKLTVFGLALTVLVVFAVSTAAASEVYFDPDPSSAALGDTTLVSMWLNSTEGVTSFQAEIYFEPSVVNITGAEAGDYATLFGWTFYGDHIRVTGTSPDYTNRPPDHWLLANFTLEGINSGTSVLHHTTESLLLNEMGDDVLATWNDGTFSCGVTPETFSKDLVEGWNLISLPLTPLLDNSTSAVLGGTMEYNAVYSYNAATKQFEDIKTGTMDPGIGYFVHVTTAGTWTYNGIAKTSMSVPLEQGLNMVGWLNCTKSISDGLSSIDGNYYYVARWNAAEKKFETYNPVAPSGFNDFADMERGTGYFISAKAESTLSESC